MEGQVLVYGAKVGDLFQIGIDLLIRKIGKHGTGGKSPRMVLVFLNKFMSLRK